MAQINNDSELFLGLISPVGTDVDNVITYLKEHLLKFNYYTEIISVSRDILAKYSSIPIPSDEYKRIAHFMDLGNWVREKAKDSSILMRGVSALLYNNRVSNGNPLPKKRIAYIIKSIKHPDEVAFMRDTYGDGFHLIGITSSYDRRLNYLTNRKNIPEPQAKELLDRDASEKIGHGQHTQDVFQQADYFINAGNNADEIQSSIARLIDLLFGDPFISPSFEEYAMFMAYTSSLRSADLSRQIGAVIVRDNEIIASGVNDCPKAFGGLYWPIKCSNGEYNDEANGRDYTLGYDSNKIEQSKIINNILESFDIEINEENIRKVKDSGIGDLTEYGRVVHAEMEALLMCARNNVSCRGADLYATTFPCHNCAKHIITAGIKKVVYIEPYPKSKAFDFYKNEISDNPAEVDKKVLFIPFVGVGPHRFIDLFAMKSIKSYTRIRKNDEGLKITWERSTANLRNPMPLLNYLDSEKAALIVYEEELEALKEESHEKSND